MDNKFRAVIYMLLSSLFFSFMNVLIKISGDIPMFNRIFFINLITVILIYIVAKKNKKPLLGKKENRKHLIIRAILGYLALVFNFYCVSKLLLADSSMLNKLSPFFVILFSFIFLKEKIKKEQFVILILIFIGALFVIKPQFSFDILPALSGVLSALFSGAAYTILRYLRDKEDLLTILFYFSIISIIGTLPIMITTFKAINMYQLFMLLGMSLFWIGGQGYMTFAYKFAPASEVSIYSYSSIIFSTILGLMFFKEYPDSLSCFGGILIILSGIANIYLGKHHLILKPKH